MESIKKAAAAKFQLHFFFFFSIYTERLKWQMSRFPQEFWNVATRALVRLATDVGQRGPAHSWRSTSTEGCWMRVKVTSLCWPVKFFHTKLGKIISSWTSLWARRHFEVEPGQGPNCHHKVRKTLLSEMTLYDAALKLPSLEMYAMRDSKRIAE